MMAKKYSETIEVPDEQSIHYLEGKKQVTFTVHIIILIYHCRVKQRLHDRHSASIYPAHTTFDHSQEGSHCSKANLSH